MLPVELLRSPSLAVSCLMYAGSNSTSFSDAEIAEMREEIRSNNNKLTAVRLRIRQLSTEFGKSSS